MKPEPIKVLSIEEALNEVGGHNFFQKVLLFILAGVWLSYGWFLNGLVFLLDSYQTTLTFEIKRGEELDVAIIETMFFLGIGAGAAINSYFNDTFGRKPMLIICQLILILAEGGLLYLQPQIFGFSIGVFFVGLAYGVGEIAAIVTLSEFIDKEHRNVFLGLMNISWGISAFGMAYLYSLYEDWTVLLKAMIAVGSVSLLPLFFVQESPHFLVSVKGNHARAREVLDRVAAVNKLPQFSGRLQGEARVHLPGEKDAASANARNRPRIMSENTIVTTESILHIRAQAYNHGCTSLLLYRSIIALLCIMIYNWFAIAIAFFVLYLNLNHFRIDPTKLGMALGACEIISVISAICLMQKGRRLSIIVFTIIATFCCVASQMADYLGYRDIQLYSLGLLRFGISGCWTTLFTATSESFPTVIRSVAFGACSAAARISGMMAPAIVELGLEYEIDPLLIVFVVLVLMTVVSFKTPETLNKDLPDFIPEEDEHEVKPPYDKFQDSSN